MRRILKPAFVTALSAAIGLLAGGRAWAQCPFCRSALETQGPNAASSINLAIVILLFPAVLLFTGVFVTAFRSAKAASSDAEPKDIL